MDKMIRLIAGIIIILLGFTSIAGGARSGSSRSLPRLYAGALYMPCFASIHAAKAGAAAANKLKRFTGTTLSIKISKLFIKALFIKRG